MDYDCCLFANIHCTMSQLRSTVDAVLDVSRMACVQLSGVPKNLYLREMMQMLRD